MGRETRKTHLRHALFRACLLEIRRFSARLRQPRDREKERERERESWKRVGVENVFSKLLCVAPIQTPARENI